MADNVGSAAVSVVSVSTTAVQVVDGSPRRENLAVKHCGTNSTASVFFGPTSAVSTSNGYEVSMREAHEFTNYNGPVFAIANAAATPLRLWEAG